MRILIFAISFMTSWIANAQAVSDSDLISAYNAIATISQDQSSDMSFEISLIKSVYANPDALVRRCKTAYSKNPQIELRDQWAIFVHQLHDGSLVSHYLSCSYMQPDYLKKNAYQYWVMKDVYPRTDTIVLNSILRGSDTKLKLQVDPAVKELIYIFDQCSNYIGDVYRGVHLSDDALKSFKTGQIVAMAAFTSATTDRSYANKWATGEAGSGESGGYLITIKSATCKDIREFNPRENEIVCLPGTKFLVENRDDIARTMRLRQLP